MLRPGIIPVGVFSDHDIKTVAGFCSAALSISPSCRRRDRGINPAFKGACPKPVIKAFRERSKADIEKWRSFLRQITLLLDRRTEGRDSTGNPSVIPAGRFSCRASITETSAPRVNKSYCIDISAEMKQTV
jgi:hypothetical protein